MVYKMLANLIPVLGILFKKNLIKLWDQIEISEVMTLIDT